MFDFARSALVWLHTSWTLRLLPLVLLPATLLMHGVDPADIPQWIAAPLLIGTIIAFFIWWLREHLVGWRRPRRDRKLPILQQVQDDNREDIEFGDRLGLPRVQQPPPPRAVEAFIRVFGVRAPAYIDGLVQTVFLGSAAIILFVSFESGPTALKDILSSIGLSLSLPDRTATALTFSAIAALATIRLWTSRYRAELDNEPGDVVPAMAYGPRT